MKSISLTTVGAVCAIVVVIGFIVGIALSIASGVETVIPETGDGMIEWSEAVDEERGLFVAAAWIVVFAGLIGIVALVGFYDALREAGPIMIIGPVVGAVGLTLVTISHAIPIAMAYELVPAYLDASEPSRGTLAATADTFAMVCQVTNYAGNALGWGVMVPLFSIAVLRTPILPHWIGWLGMVTAVLAGWLALLSPASSVIEGLSSIGFLTFFVWMLAMGIALLRYERRASHLAAQAS